MNGKLCRSLLAFIAIIPATAGLAAAAHPPESTPDNVPRFLGEIEKAGFSAQEGSFSFFDLIKQVCEGGDRYFSAMGNNPWPNAYFVLQMPNPDVVDYQLPFAMNWQIRQDEAMVLIGQTPPPVRYFGLQTWVNMGPAQPLGTAVTDNRTPVGAAFGDSINNLTVRSTGSDPFNRPVVYIVTGNRQTEMLVCKAVLAAGYPEAIINVERLSTVIGPLGYGPAGSILLARHCGNEPYCLEVGNPTDINGVPYNDNCSPQIDLEIDPARPSWASDLFVAFRNYLEPATAVSADSNELVWDRASYFGPYFSGQ